MDGTKKHTWSFTTNFGLRAERDYFIENVSMLVSSGMMVLDAIDAVAGDMRTKRMQAIMARIRSDIESGSPVWRALDEVHTFSRHTITLVRLGEESSRLPENLRLVSLQEKKDRVFRARIRSAMMYPVFVMGLTLTVGIGIAWFILPRLATVFSQLHIKLPIITKILIQVGIFLGKHGLVAVPLLLLVLGGLVCVALYTPRIRSLLQSMLLHIPGVGQLVRETELARFGYLFGTLLDAGLPATQALASLSEAAFVPPYKRLYAVLGKSVEEGNSFQISFAAYPHLNRLIPNPIQHLIVSAERSGNLSGALLSISKDYDERSEMTTKNLSVILEPILLVIVWLGVVSVALAVILPIYSLLDGLH